MKDSVERILKWRQDFVGADVLKLGPGSVAAAGSKVERVASELWPTRVLNKADKFGHPVVIERVAAVDKDSLVKEVCSCNRRGGRGVEEVVERKRPLALHAAKEIFLTLSLPLSLTCASVCVACVPQSRGGVRDYPVGEVLLARAQLMEAIAELARLNSLRIPGRRLNIFFF